MKKVVIQREGRDESLDGEETHNVVSAVELVLVSEVRGLDGTLVLEVGLVRGDKGVSGRDGESVLEGGLNGLLDVVEAAQDESNTGQFWEGESEERRRGDGRKRNWLFSIRAWAPSRELMPDPLTSL